MLFQLHRRGSQHRRKRLRQTIRTVTCPASLMKRPLRRREAPQPSQKKRSLPRRKPRRRPKLQTIPITLTATLLEITDRLAIGIVQATGNTMQGMGDRIALMATGLVAINITSPGVGAIMTIFLAGLAIALLAPAAGIRADTSGRHKLWLGVNTGLVVVAMAGMFFVRDDPGYLLPGLLLVAIGSVRSAVRTAEPSTAPVTVIPSGARL